MDPVTFEELIENVEYHKKNYDTRGINKNRVSYRKALLELMKYCKAERDTTTPKQVKKKFKQETE
jgi:hypothetical protein